MLDAVKRAALPGVPAIHGFDASCFDGVYITGDISVEDITRLGQHRVGVEEDAADHSRLALPNADVR
jgi:amidophosphoribosyltransferase